MGRELHHRKKDDKYALWSTITEDYISEWGSKEEIKKEWLDRMIKESRRKVDKYIEEIDKEVSD